MEPPTTTARPNAERASGSARPIQIQSAAEVKIGTIVRKTMAVSTEAACSSLIFVKIAMPKKSGTSRKPRARAHTSGSHSSCPESESSRTTAADDTNCRLMSVPGNGKTLSAHLFTIITEHAYAERDAGESRHRSTSK